ncbi:hypothetical protein A0J61_05474 [Choanephora cucurbitarum]|uniref:Uncharacterized protein n=1 Tax=Choanephora cucurbitarum TaxID=101091 RepID=A0A1C7NBN0_9FUNG|nr:hypothetical protein A0J61_05474 [Choanephora cucurbitarum]
MIPQVIRPSVAISKRSLVRTYFASRVSAFNHQEPNYQLEKAHHQAAPLTDSTLYAPQGHTSTPAPNASASSAAASKANESTTATVFTPSVNAVFDD